MTVTALKTNSNDESLTMHRAVEMALFKLTTINHELVRLSKRQMAMGNSLEDLEKISDTDIENLLGILSEKAEEALNVAHEALCNLNKGEFFGGDEESYKHVLRDVREFEARQAERA